MACLEHRIVQLHTAQPGYALLEWEGDWETVCPFDRELKDLRLEDVTLWLVVEHTDDDGTFQSIEPWSAEAGLAGTREPDEWELSAACKVGHGSVHGEQRIFGPRAAVEARRQTLREGTCHGVTTPA